MDNENKEMELEPQATMPEANEVEFDPTESEEFYNNLEAAINAEESVETEAKAEPEITSEAVLEPVVAETEENPDYSAAEDVLFAGVDAALAEQIEQEFGKDVEASTVEKKEPNKFLAMLKSIPTWTKVLVSVILVILVSVGLLFGTPGGRKLVYKAMVGIMFNIIPEDKNNITPNPTNPGETITITPEPTADPNQNPDTTPEPTTEPDQTPTPTPEGSDEPTTVPEPTATPIPAIKVMDDENIINVLLLGVENIYGAKWGRSDAMILVSVNLKGGPLKMVSFQRDLYVGIPGNPDDRLNASYAFGGPELIMATIEQNFGIDVDSYVKVDFDGFENIIDQLGGLRLSLTAKESEYLNEKEYISKPEQRNTVAGYQTMTGNQVVGYCRVRYVPTENGLVDDRGRNYRHRKVLKAIFDQFKEKNIIELLSIMNECIKYVAAPAELEDLAVECLTAVIEKKMFEIETMQMPQSGNFGEAKITGKDVIVFYPEAVEALQEFLYGNQ